MKKVTTTLLFFLLLLFASNYGFAQGLVITGKVTMHNGEPAKGASDKPSVTINMGTINS